MSKCVYKWTREHTDFIKKLQVDKSCARDDVGTCIYRYTVYLEKSVHQFTLFIGFINNENLKEYFSTEIVFKYLQ